MVLIISYFAIKETLRALEIVNMCISFVAVLLIVFYSSKTNSEANSQEGEAISNKEVMEVNVHFVFGVLANAFATLCFSIINVIVRSLKDVHHSIVA